MPAVHGPYLRPYGGEPDNETEFDFVLYDRSGNDFDGGLSTIVETGDCKIIKDEASSVNTTNVFVGNNGGYTIVITNAEMSCGKGVIYIIDQSTPKRWIDTAIFFETYGNPLAEHPNIGKV